MIEFLRHAIGICGEPHPSLLTLLMGSPAIGYMVYRIKNYGKNKNIKRAKASKDIRV